MKAEKRERPTILIVEINGVRFRCDLTTNKERVLFVYEQKAGTSLRIKAIGLDAYGNNLGDHPSPVVLSDIDAEKLDITDNGDSTFTSRSIGPAGTVTINVVDASDPSKGGQAIAKVLPAELAKLDLVSAE